MRFTVPYMTVQLENISFSTRRSVGQRASHTIIFVLMLMTCHWAALLKDELKETVNSEVKPPVHLAFFGNHLNKDPILRLLLSRGNLSSEGETVP